MVMTCVHYRIKNRLTDNTGKINPFFMNISCLRYCNTSLYIQLAGHDRILDVIRKYPILFPGPEILDGEMKTWSVSINAVIV